jgi:hypothetical protein
MSARFVWLPTWNEKPTGLSPSSTARPSSRTAMSRSQPNFRVSGQSASEVSTISRM